MIEDKALTFRDFADSLKMEVSDVHPKKEKHIKEFAIKVMGVVERKYGKYFGPNTLNKTRGLEERIVSFSPGTFPEYLKLVDPALAGVAGKIGGIRVSEDCGYLVGVESRKSLMKEEGSSEAVDHIMTMAPLSRRQSIKLFKTMVFMHDTIHEIIHAYQTPGLPFYFSECAAPYYAIEVQEELEYVGVVGEEDKRRVDFYKGFIEDFGEDLHSLFFGAKRNREFKNKVLTAAFTSEIVKETLPEGYGTRKSL